MFICVPKRFDLYIYCCKVTDSFGANIGQKRSKSAKICQKVQKCVKNCKHILLFVTNIGNVCDNHCLQSSAVFD